MLRAALAAAVTLGTMLLAPLAQAQAAPSDFTTATRYDAERRVTGTIAADPDGSGPLHYAALRNSYDTAGRLIRVEKGELATWQPEIGQPGGVAPANWSGFTVFSQVDTVYDIMDRKVIVTVSSAGTAYSATQYSYDAVGRLDCTAVRMNPAVYTALPASACTLGTEGTQGPDRITRNVYDAAGQVFKVQKAYGTPLQQDYASYAYSLNGKQIRVIDANGNQASMTYDGFDRQVQWNFPDKTNIGAVSTTDYEAYTYDPNGNRLTLRKRDGSVIGYSYDALNRMTLKDIPGSTTADVYYGYDAQGHQLFARFGSASGAGLTNTYDGFGRLTSASSNLDGTARTLAYQYDADNNRTRITHPDGTYFAYVYDGLNRSIAIQENGLGQVAGFSYDNQGRHWGEARGPVMTSYGYDAVSRLNGLTHDLTGTSGDVSWGLGYNPANQIVAQTRNNDAYAFTGYATVSKAYAVNGLNQYTTADSASPTYDPNGNLTSDGTTGYTYDVENRLVSSSSGATLSYDPSGRLWQMVMGASTVRFLYDGDQLLEERDGSGTLLRRYVHGNDEDDPLLWYDGAGLTDRRSFQIDHQGSITSIANVDGTLRTINSYDEYGTPGASNDGRFQYTGQAWLPALGLYYYKARIYSPKLGRFLQTDPIGYGDQNNLYAYVGNDPIDGRDSNGLRHGDVYSNIYDAAVAAAQEYVQESANENREFGGFFYTVKGGISYTAPWKGGEASVDLPNGCWFKNCFEAWHTHGFPSPKYDNEHFSGSDGDIGSANANGRPLWLFAPSGYLSRYDPRSRKISKSKRSVLKKDENSEQSNNVDQHGAADQSGIAKQSSQMMPSINIDSHDDICRWSGNCVNIGNSKQ